MLFSYSNLDPISQEMLRAGKDGVILAVERSIAAEIPARFSIMLNGWTHASERCIAVFACYEVNGCLKTPQLTMAPLFDAQDDVLSEQGHLELCYRVSCASHGLNLAIQAEMASHEEGSDAVQVIMVKLRTLTQSAKLRMLTFVIILGKIETPLRSVIRQDTRWSTTIDMVQRYIKLLEFLDVEDDDIMELLPSPAASKRLRAFYQELRDFEPYFKSGCVRVLRGKTHHLMRADKAALKQFEATRLVEETSNAEEDDAFGSCVERLRKRRRFEQDCVTYEQLKSIPPTSNVVKRFFSIAKFGVPADLKPESDVDSLRLWDLERDLMFVCAPDPEMCSLGSGKRVWREASDFISGLGCHSWDVESTS
ncbi:hypothetical protein ON010_g3662 [Phytophthora cinnamomi]|nr:hypothetical protein ON010_g3662 [Phytophthora cinnamomi]